MMVLEVILSVLLFILKAIGIILLAVLALLLLTVLSILFVPVRYKAEGRISVGTENNGKSEPSSNMEKSNADTYNDGQKLTSGNVKAGISWLFHIISIKVWSEENRLHYYGKVFGIRIVDSNRQKPKKENKKRSNKKNTNDDKDKAAGQGEIIYITEEKENEERQNEERQNKEKEDVKKEYTEDNGEYKEHSNNEDNIKKSLEEKIREICHSIFTKIQNIKFKFLEICDKIKNVNGIREEFSAFLSTEESRSAIAEIKYRIIKILLHIMPTRLRINAAYGLTDPALTGQVYGALCILLSRYGDKVYINPQFTDVEKPFVCGDFKCKGRIKTAVLLIHAIKIYKIKRLKEFIAFAKGKGKKNGR